MQNLRNKYQKHPIIEPLINCCKQKNMSFEFLKETEKIAERSKCFRHLNKYYIKIGDSVLDNEENACSSTDLIDLFINAYRHLNLDYPDRLQKAANTFHKA